MGLPIFDVEFYEKVETFIKRSAQGVVCLVLKDTKLEKNKIHSFKKFNRIEKDKIDAKSLDLLKLTFLGKPREVKVVAIDDYDSTGNEKVGLTEALKQLKYTRFNYLAIPGLKESKHKEVIDFIKNHREEFYRPCRAILFNYKDSEGVGSKEIYNWTTDNIVSHNKSYSGSEYTCRLAGALAGTPINQSITNYEFYEVSSCDLKDSLSDCDKAVDNGEIFLITDGDSFNIARGVTSLKKAEGDEIEDFKKIRISETADMIYQDIKDAWEKHYLGKVMNTYKNKLSFFSVVRDYLQGLEKIGVLDTDITNKLTIDLEGNENYLREHDVNVDKMTEAQIKEANTGSYLYAMGFLSIADAMEDLVLKFYI